MRVARSELRSEETGEELMASKAGTSTSEFADTVSSTAENVKEKVTDAAESARQRVSEAGRQATGKIDEKRAPAADALQNAASTLHERAEDLPGGETVRSVAHSAADKLESTAGYIREHDVRAMVSDVEDVVRRNPGPSLLIAAAVGFLIGRAFRED
jgi:ElaB/YqjD/DUF883 family membrane-anchored ribosome-binding protein